MHKEKTKNDHDWCASFRSSLPITKKNYTSSVCVFPSSSPEAALWCGWSEELSLWEKMGTCLLYLDLVVILFAFWGYLSALKLGNGQPEFLFLTWTIFSELSQDKELMNMSSHKSWCDSAYLSPLFKSLPLKLECKYVAYDRMHPFHFFLHLKHFRKVPLCSF